MRASKKLNQRIDATLAIVTRLENRVADLEAGGKIDVLRPLTESELSIQNPNITYQLANYIDTFPLKNVIQLLLDHFDLELKRISKYDTLESKKIEKEMQ